MESSFVLVLLLALLLPGLLFGGICAAIASGKRHSVPLWFILGFFFGIIPLIIILCLSPAGGGGSRRYGRGRTRGRPRGGRPATGRYGRTTAMARTGYR